MNLLVSSKYKLSEDCSHIIYGHTCNQMADCHILSEILEEWYINLVTSHHPIKNQFYIVKHSLFLTIAKQLRNSVVLDDPLTISYVVHCNGVIII